MLKWIVPPKGFFMQMYLTSLWLFVGACLLAAEPNPNSAKEHCDKVQGVWAAVELDGAGQNVPKDGQEFRLLFKDDTVIFDHGGEKKEYRFRLQRTQFPQQGEIDLIAPGDKDAKPTWRGIYFLSDAHFKMCFSKNDPQKRPPEFSAKVDLGLWVIECSRPKP
jgi:uncharacterized protein (TIGR03067 family)